MRLTPDRDPPLPILGALALSSLACGTPPKTAAEFRAAVRAGGFMTEVVEFDTERPLGEVAQTFERRAPECLNVEVATTSTTSTSYQHIVTVFKPTLVVTEKRVELHVQRHHASGVVGVYEEPEGGYFLLVADATPLDASRTKVEIHGPSAGFDALMEGVEAWARGEHENCPDLTPE